MTVRSIADKYDFLDTATEEDLQDFMQSDDPMTVMMNDIEAVIEGNEYEDVYGALSLILVNAIKEQYGTADPQMVLGTINLHMSAAWTMVMGSPDHMTMN